MKITVETVARHRNGVCGAPFHVVTFRWAESKDEPRPMVAVLFDPPGMCAVLDREETRQGNIAFAMGNSWRGDLFEASLRKAVAAYEAKVAADWTLLTTGESDRRVEIRGEEDKS